MKEEFEALIVKPEFYSHYIYYIPGGFLCLVFAWWIMFMLDDWLKNNINRRHCISQERYQIISLLINFTSKISWRSFIVYIWTYLLMYVWLFAILFTLFILHIVDSKAEHEQKYNERVLKHEQVIKDIDKLGYEKAFLKFKKDNN